jgi:hypothetical protein
MFRQSDARFSQWRRDINPRTANVLNIVVKQLFVVVLQYSLANDPSTKIYAHVCRLGMVQIVHLRRQYQDSECHPTRRTGKKSQIN